METSSRINDPNTADTERDLVNLHRHPGPGFPARSSQEQSALSHAVQCKNKYFAAPEEQLQVESPSSRLSKVDENAFQCLF